MNLRERGLTVGDLVLISVFIISTVFVVNKFRDNDKQANIYITPNQIPSAIKN